MTVDADAKNLSRFPAGRTQSARPVARVHRARIGAAGLRAALGKLALPAWFLAIDLIFPLHDTRVLLVDSRLYQQATNAWLAGGDPWAQSAFGVPYAAAPWSLLLYLPTAWLPLELAGWVWMGLGLGAAVWLLRRLHLPLWWLAFPPLAEALWNGNAQPIVLAALLVRAPWGVTVAAGVKLYGFIPAVVARRWREVAIAVLVLGVTLPLLPWGLWVDHRFGFEAATSLTWNGSAWRFTPLIPLVILALVVLRDRGAEWLTIPALWPGTQFFYHVFALPALQGRPVLAALLALPIPLIAPLAVIGYALFITRPSWLAPESVRRVVRASR